MTFIDWAIVAALLLLLTAGAASTRRHATTVTAFLAAERCGGRYIIAVADNMARLGVLTLVWYFEINYERGFTSIWWTLMEEPVLIVMALSGWVIYRFRQTRSMTLAEFFERRYSRKFRIFAGWVAFLAGMINFGIFPSVGARFFMALWNMPESFQFLGFEWSTFVCMMIASLAIPLALIFFGGQLAIMVTDFIQGIVANASFIIIIFYLLNKFDWIHISDVLMSAPAGDSKVDPFNMGGDAQFGVSYFIISVITVFYVAYCWQGTQGYNCAAINAHEAQMAYIIGQWRFRVLMLITVVLPICIRTFLTHADFATAAAPVHDALSALPTDALQNQLRSPLAMRAMLPTGLLGLATVAMLGPLISTHDTYMHSWGVIFIQDIVLPLRKKAFPPKQHLRLLKLAVFGVAVFIFIFSYYFRHAQYIAMYCAVSAAVFVGGAGICLIGGLYWNRGTTAAAWTAMITGMTIALGGTAIEQTPTDWLQNASINGLVSPIWQAALYLQNHLDGQEMNLCAMLGSTFTYFAVSLLGPKRIANLDRLLHRGKCAIAGENAESINDAKTFWEKLGLTREFTGKDRVITAFTLSWPLFWSVVFVVVTAYCLTNQVDASRWLAYWHVWMWVILAFAVVITSWLFIGGLRDLRRLFRMLRERRPDASDDGRVASTPDSEVGFPVVTDSDASSGR